VFSLTSNKLVDYLISSFIHSFIHSFFYAVTDCCRKHQLQELEELSTDSGQPSSTVTSDAIQDTSTPDISTPDPSYAQIQLDPTTSSPRNADLRQDNYVNIAAGPVMYSELERKDSNGYIVAPSGDLYAQVQKR